MEAMRKEKSSVVNHILKSVTKIPQEKKKEREKKEKRPTEEARKKI